MCAGWIKLHRKILDNFLWTEKREFSKAECWIDILLNVRHSEEPSKLLLKGQIVECNQGECVLSLDSWARRWNMQKSKVRRVLNLFQSMNMIELENVRVSTRLKVLKFSEYAIERHADETQTKRRRNADETQATPNKNEKNERMKECKNIESKDSCAPVECTDLIQASKSIQKQSQKKQVDTAFEIFWAAYPKKKGKKQAIRAWEKIKPSPTIAEAEKLAQIVSMQARTPQWTKDGGEFIPLPATWLNGERWNDELETKTHDVYTSTDW